MASKYNEISSLAFSSEDGEEVEEEEEEDREEYRKGGYHFVLPGDQFLGSRYVAQRKLGWGNFSTVWLAYDMQLKKFVALKIQKSAQNFTAAALEEIEILRVVSQGDPQGSKGVVKLLNHFNHSGPNGIHVCMVLEVLGESLLKLLTYNRYRGLELSKVKEICCDVLLGLNYLHRELGIIHTDLKLENVMLVSSIDPAKDPQRSGLVPILERTERKINGATGIGEKKLRKKVNKPAETEKARSLEGVNLRCKIVDMGNACWKNHKYTDEIQTRQYRAPEVILGYEYTDAVDMWSFACLAFEIATGDMLFEAKNGEGFDCDLDHLALMIELLGKLPRKVAIGGSRSKHFFDRYGDLKNIKRFKFWPLNKVLLEKYKFTDSDADEFSDFLTPLLDYSPEKRPTAEQCLQHPWISGKTKSVVSEDKNIGNLEKSQNPEQVEVSQLVRVKEAVSKLNAKENVTKLSKEPVSKTNAKETESALDAKEVMSKLNNKEASCRSNAKEASHTIDAKESVSRSSNKDVVSKSNAKEAERAPNGKDVSIRLNAKESVKKLNAKEAAIRPDNKEAVHRPNAKENVITMDSEQSKIKLNTKDAASRTNAKEPTSTSDVKDTTSMFSNNKEVGSNTGAKETCSKSDDAQVPISKLNAGGRPSVGGEAVIRFTSVREAVSKLNVRVAK